MKKRYWITAVGQKTKRQVLRDFTSTEKDALMVFDSEFRAKHDGSINDKYPFLFLELFEYNQGCLIQIARC